MIDAQTDMQSAIREAKAAFIDTFAPIQIGIFKILEKVFDIITGILEILKELDSITYLT
jgi:hypothetical protein